MSYFVKKMKACSKLDRPVLNEHAFYDLRVKIRQAIHNQFIIRPTLERNMSY